MSYDPLGYVVTQTVTANADGSTTIVNTAARPDGSIASETTSTVVPPGCMGRAGEGRYAARFAGLSKYGLTVAATASP